MDKTIAELAQRMIAYSTGNLHDINHFLKVYAYARTIGVREGLGEADQTALEAAALLHDIACPLCREKYGNTNGKYQEREGGPLAAELLRDSSLSVLGVAQSVGYSSASQFRRASSESTREAKRGWSWFSRHRSFT